MSHDAVVVGGGAAGLSAATWLARYRRDVVVVDSGDYRAGRVEVSHGYLGQGEMKPMQLLLAAREHLVGYRTVAYRRGRVVAARRCDEGFELRTDVGDTVRALRVVLATGVTDTYPDLEGFDEHYGASAFHCPACDGYDAAGRDVVAFGWDERLVGFATSLLDWARSVTVLTGGRRFDGDQTCLDVLDRYGVEVIETPVARMLGTRGDLRGIELADGRLVRATVFFFSVDHRPRTALAQALGCDIDSGGFVVVDADCQTTIPGVFAAGDVTPGMQLVQVAAAKGAIAGVSASLSLHGEAGSPLSPPPAPDAPSEVQAPRP